MSTALSARAGLRAWLLSDAPGSRLQAGAGAAYLAWRAFSRNVLAMAGLAIVLVLLAIAATAPELATHSPFAQDLAGRLKPPEIGRAHV